MIVIGQTHSLEGSAMRHHQGIAIAIARVAGLGVRQLFFAASTAGANAATVKNSGFDLLADVPSFGRVNHCAAMVRDARAARGLLTMRVVGGLYSSNRNKRPHPEGLAASAARRLEGWPRKDSQALRIGRGST